MACRVTHFNDAGAALAAARVFLASVPSHHNLVHSLLTVRAETGEPGDYWVAAVDDTTVGVVFQSPPGFWVAATPMPPEAVAPVVDAMTAAGVAMPGIEADAATASTLASAWAERHGVGAEPVLAMRLRELTALHQPTGVPGALRTATDDDLPAVIEWIAGFGAAIGESPPKDGELRRRVAAGLLAWWEVEGSPVCLVGRTVPVAGVVRIAPVYTPETHRRHGYAGACTGAVSAAMVAAGHTCILFANLANPTSNAVYARLGYDVVGVFVRYAFAGPISNALP